MGGLFLGWGGTYYDIHSIVFDLKRRSFHVFSAESEKFDQKKNYFGNF